MGLWDVLSAAANLAQLSGLHAVMLVAVAMGLLRIPQNRRERNKLEQSVRKLCSLLQWPAGCEVVLQHSEMAGLVSKALVEAGDLVNSYDNSTLWCRVRSGRSMLARFRDMQNCINSYCCLVLFMNAHLVIQAAMDHPPSDTSTMIHQQTNNYPSHGARPTGPKTSATGGTQSIGQG